MTNIFINPKSKSIRITGTVNIVDAEGNVVETLNNPKLCGCGKAKTYICDGSHKEKK
jgi:CDGSH-type Zn-finger protein